MAKKQNDARSRGDWQPIESPATQTQSKGGDGIMTTTNYTVRRYDNGRAIGSVDLTDEQFARYMAMSQQPQGIIRLGAMPHDLDVEYQDTHEDTVIYLD